MDLTVDVLIPTYKPGEDLAELIKRLQAQSHPPAHIILMNTQEAYFPSKLCDLYENVSVQHLPKADFDHGGTRDLGMRKSSADVVICMTQDAMPANRMLIEELIKPFADEKVWASYARQLPKKDCRQVEQYTRSFNYPSKSQIKSREDLQRLGIKTFFCSNVCAAWRKDAYVALGGFETHTIFNEDMIFAGKLVREGGKIAYCAEAKVLHSHNYSAMEQLHRNFDLAVSQAMHPEIFGGISSESEGIRLVKKSLAYCIRIGKPWLAFSVLTQSAGKFIGYRLGKQYQKLPGSLIRFCTMNPSFWEKEQA